MAPCLTQYEGALPHYLPQHGSCAEQGHPGETELTWQELMSLAELQGLDTNGEIATDSMFYAGAPQLPLPDPYGLAAPAWPGHNAMAAPSAPTGYPPPYEGRQLGASGYEPAGPADPCCLSLSGLLGDTLLLGERQGPGPVAKRREDPESDSGLSLDSSPDGYGPADPAGRGAGPDFHGQWCYGTLPQHSDSGEAPVRAPYSRAKRDSCSRDERRAQAMRIPFSTDTIVNLPVDDFNELVSRHRLSEPQLALVRDIRRRGKNKVAAQNCRQRKLENIAQLERELGGLRSERERLAGEREGFDRALHQARQKMGELRQRVFGALRDAQGRPYSPEEFWLQQAPDGGVFLVPREAARGGD